MSRETPSSHASPATAGSPTDSRGTSFSSSVENRVRNDIDALVVSHPMGEALSELALTLARALDDGAGMATAAVARELRAVLNDLAGSVVHDDDGLDAFLSSPVRDAEDP